METDATSLTVHRWVRIKEKTDRYVDLMSPRLTNSRPVTLHPPSLRVVKILIRDC